VSDPYELERFVAAQASVYPRVVAELTEGHKRSHWKWFIFPQVAGLGFSATAQRFAIYSRAEAEAYLAHRPMMFALLGDALCHLLGQFEGPFGSGATKLFEPYRWRTFH
jgi:uncharacterized protein (DUF1810 family)